MGKISPVSSKYIINANIEIEGVVDRPDVIGAIFGQTEGLLGSDLELRELQRSGRIGRIEVNIETRTGKTKGSIIVPGALLETCFQLFWALHISLCSNAWAQEPGLMLAG